MATAAFDPATHRKCMNCHGEGKRRYPQRNGPAQEMDCFTCDGAGAIAKDPEYRVLRDRHGVLIDRSIIDIGR